MANYLTYQKKAYMLYSSESILFKTTTVKGPRSKVL